MGGVSDVMYAASELSMHRKYRASSRIPNTEHGPSARIVGEQTSRFIFGWVASEDSSERRERVRGVSGTLHCTRFP